MNEIHLFRALNAYLAVMFLVGLAQGLQFYLAIIGLVKKAPGRWPRLVRMLGEHVLALVTPGLLWPLTASLILMIGQWVSTIFIWPAADGFVLAQTDWMYWTVLIPVGFAMICWDIFRILQGTTLDSKALEPYLDLAEGVLHPTAAVFSKTFTFGRFNPATLVSAELKKHLSVIDQSMRTSLWSMNVSLLLRGLFASTLWLAFYRH